MEGLPTPLSRVELYLAKAAGMNVTPPEPKSRLELFLAKIAGMDVEMPAPLSLKEMWLAHVAGSAPIEPLAIEGAFYIDNQKVDVRYLAVAAGVIGATLPEKPQNRKEQYWLAIAGGAPIVGVLKYVTGTNIALTDVVSGIEELQFVYGDTYQQTYSGKNTVDFSTITFTNVNNGSGTREGGTYTVTGGPNDVWGGIYFPQSGLQLKTSTTYTFSATVQSTTATNGSKVFATRYASETGAGVEGNLAKAGERSVVTFTTPSSFASNPDLRLLPYGKSATAVYTDIMLEESATATPYEPYTGGIPAPNPDYPQDINVVTGAQTVTIGDGVSSQSYPISLTGKNLWGGLPSDVNLTGSIAWINKADGTITADGTASSTSQSMYSSSAVSNNHTIILQAGTYTLSGGISDVVKLELVKSDGTTLGTCTATPRVITLSAETTVFVRGIITSGTTVSNITLKPMLEKGETATPYAPYFTPIELCKLGDYQDYIYKSGDDWYVHKAIYKYTFTGNEPWALRNTTAEGVSTFSWTFADMPAYAHVDAAVNASKCSYLNNHGRVTNSNQMFYSFIGFAFYSRTESPDVSSFYANTKDADLPTFKSGVTGELLYYVLATASDAQITDATLVGQLNAIDSAVLPKPVAYITVGATDPNLPAPIKISYYGESE